MYAQFEKLCNEKGVTPYKVAKETGLTTATLSNWKSGRYVPKHDKMQRIAKFFGVSVEYLMRDEEDPTPSPAPQNDYVISENDDLRYILDTVGKWSDAQKKRLRSYIEGVDRIIGGEE